MGYMSEEEILQFVEEQMSIRDSNRIQELEVKVDKLEVMVRTLLDAFTCHNDQKYVSYFRHTCLSLLVAIGGL